MNTEDMDKKKIPLAKWTVGITHLPEQGNNAKAYFPTHSFNVIKKYREDIYKVFVIGDFYKERQIKRIKITNKDLELLRIHWLQSELKEIERISNIPGITRSDQIELGKYRDYVNSELTDLVKKHPSLEGSGEGSKNDYILKNESVIIKLFEEYGGEFPDETKELWKKRWINGSDTLTPIRIDEFKNGNNKHLLLTILHEAFDFMRVDGDKKNYIKKRWGLKSYHSDITRHLGFDREYNCYRDPHPQTEKIKIILKPESF